MLIGKLYKMLKPTIIWSLGWHQVLDTINTEDVFLLLEVIPVPSDHEDIIKILTSDNIIGYTNIRHGTDKLIMVSSPEE